MATETARYYLKNGKRADVLTEEINVHGSRGMVTVRVTTYRQPVAHHANFTHLQLTTVDPLTSCWAYEATVSRGEQWVGGTTASHYFINPTQRDGAVHRYITEWLS